MNRLFLKEESHRVEEPSHNHDERIRFVLSLLQTPALLHSDRLSLPLGFTYVKTYYTSKAPLTNMNLSGKKRCLKVIEVQSYKH